MEWRWYNFLENVGVFLGHPIPPFAPSSAAVWSCRRERAGAPQRRRVRCRVRCLVALLLLQKPLAQVITRQPYACHLPLLSGGSVMVQVVIRSGTEPSLNCAVFSDARTMRHEASAIRLIPQASRALSRFLVASCVLSRFSVASRALSRFKLGRVVSPAAPGRGLSRVLCPPLQSRLAPAGPPVDVVAGPAFVEVPLAVGPAPARPVPAARGVGAARSCAPLTLLLGRPRRRRLHLLAHLHRHVAPLLVHTPDGAVPGLGAVAAVPTAGTDNTPTPR